MPRHAGSVDGERRRVNEPGAERDPRGYYDACAAGYDAVRTSRYHRLLDDGAVRLAAPHVRVRDVVEVGCGTGRLLERLAPLARRAEGVDLAPAMVARARERGLRVREGDARVLPFASATFDAVLCFRCFPHVPEPARALAEMARVLRPGGVALVELYEPRSLRGLARRFGPSRRVPGGRAETEVPTRFDRPADLRGWLPRELGVERIDGLRILVPAAAGLEVPIAGEALARLDALAGRTPLRHAAGLKVVTLRRGP